MLPRRQFVCLFVGGCIASPRSSIGQQAGKAWRVAVLTSEGDVASKSRMDAFVGALRELGYIEGRNLAITFRYAQGDVGQLPALASEIASSAPDVIFAPNTPSVLAARKAAPATPIVFSNASDPVGDGLVESLRRPGGNITGTTDIALELGTKRLGFLKDVKPSITRIAVLLDPARAGEAISAAASALGLQLLMTDLLRRDDFDRRAAEVSAWRADALYIVSGPNNTFNRALHAQFALRLRLPAMGANHEAVEAGTLMSYGPSFAALRRRAAAYVDKILRGAHPGELPVEQPTVFDLAVNLKTARALRITVPQPILLQATQLIE